MLASLYYKRCGEVRDDSRANTIHPVLNRSENAHSNAANDSPALASVSELKPTAEDASEVFVTSRDIFERRRLFSAGEKQRIDSFDCSLAKGSSPSPVDANDAISGVNTFGNTVVPFRQNPVAQPHESVTREDIPPAKVLRFSSKDALIVGNSIQDSLRDIIGKDTSSVLSQEKLSDQFFEERRRLFLETLFSPPEESANYRLDLERFRSLFYGDGTTTHRGGYNEAVASVEQINASS